MDLIKGNYLSHGEKQVGTMDIFLQSRNMFRLLNRWEAYSCRWEAYSCRWKAYSWHKKAQQKGAKCLFLTSYSSKTGNLPIVFQPTLTVNQPH